MMSRSISPSRNGLEVDMLVAQITLETLARVFSLDPATIWLKEEFGPRGFFPVDGGFRDLPTDLLCVTVEGSASMPVQTVLSPLSTSSHNTGSPYMVGHTPNQSGAGSSSTFPKPIFSKKSTAATVKVTRATMKRSPNGKVEFSPENQTFISVTEANANVHYIENVVQQKWGKSFVLVTSDGLHIEDSSGTQGLSFWKVGSRKVYAVHSSSLGKGGKTKRPATYAMVDITSDSDDDFQTPVRKKNTGSCISTSQLEKIASDIDNIRNDLEEVFKITKDTQPPLALKKMLHDTFICSICRKSPMRPPIVFARCCKRLIGCQGCVDGWYIGSETTATCPVCRSERAFADTMLFKGLDELMNAIVPLFSDNEEADEND